MTVAQTKITIDGTTILDADLTTWNKPLPEQLQNAMTGDTKAQPWIRAIMFEMAESTIIGRALAAEVKTDIDGYTLRVDHP